MMAQKSDLAGFAVVDLNRGQAGVAKTEQQVIAELFNGAQQAVEHALPDELLPQVRLGGLAAQQAEEAVMQFVRQAHRAYAANPVGIQWPSGPLEDLVQRVFRAIYGLGPFEALLEQEGVEDIAINGPGEVYVRTSAGWAQVPPDGVADLVGHSEHLLNMFNMAISASGQQAGRRAPIVDDKLPHSGHRVSLITEPVAADGVWPLIVIRRHRPISFSVEDFLQKPVDGYSPHDYRLPDYLKGWDTQAFLTPAAASLLHMSVLAGLNILVLGRTGVGKTSFLSMLGGWIPADRRVLVLEDTRELRLRQGPQPRNCVYFTTVEKRLEGGIEISMNQLVRAALRQRPDHLIIGEARGAEMWDLLQAMQTGHGGMLTSLHAIGPQDLVNRAEYMLSLAGIRRSQREVANLLGSSFHLVITLQQNYDGRRYVADISAFGGRLPSSASGEQPALETLFAGGADAEFGLKLVAKQTTLESQFRRVGLSFASVLRVAKKEQTKTGRGRR